MSKHYYAMPNFTKNMKLHFYTTSPKQRQSPIGLRFCFALFGFAIKAASAKRLGVTLRSKVISERSSRVVSVQVQQGEAKREPRQSPRFSFCLVPRRTFHHRLLSALARIRGKVCSANLVSSRSERCRWVQVGKNGASGTSPPTKARPLFMQGRADASICGSSRVKKCTHLFGRSQKREIRNYCQLAMVSDFLLFSKKMFFREFVMMCSICSILKMPPYHGFRVFI